MATGYHVHRQDHGLFRLKYAWQIQLPETRSVKSECSFGSVIVTIQSYQSEPDTERMYSQYVW